MATDADRPDSGPYGDSKDVSVERLREGLTIALDALRRSAEDHNCDYCRADVAAVERALGIA